MVTLENIIAQDQGQGLGIYFQTSFLSWGESVEHEFKPNGKDIEVTNENKQEFVQLYLKWVLVDQIKSQFDSFAKGFH